MHVPHIDEDCQPPPAFRLHLRRAAVQQPAIEGYVFTSKRVAHLAGDGAAELSAARHCTAAEKPTDRELDRTDLCGRWQCLCFLSRELCACHGAVVLYDASAAGR